MNIWLINHYAVPVQYYPLARQTNFAKHLMRMGHTVTIFAASTVHNSDKNLIEDSREYRDDYVDGIHYVYIRCHNYTGNGIKRVFNMCEFAWKLPGVCRKYEKPDAIVATSMPPMSCAMGIHLARKYKIKGIAEIADLWPESIVAYGIAGANNPAVLLLRRLEKWIYTRSDAIVFTMEGGRDYIIEKGWDTEHGGPIDLSKVHHINNGVDLEEFNYSKEHYVLDDLDLNDPEKLKIVYTGSLREINDIEGLLLAESILAGKNVPNHKVLIYGDGDKRKEWEKLVEERSIPNIVFKGRVGKKQIPYILSKADILFIDGAGDSPIVRFGMSQNKMFEYLAANKPIISPLNDNYNIVEKYGCGYKVDNCPEKIAEALELLLCSEELRADTGEAAKKAAKEYDFSALTEKLISLIEEEK